MAEAVTIDVDDLYAPVEGDEDSGGVAIEVTDSDKPPGGDSKTAEEEVEVEIEDKKKTVSGDDNRLVSLEQENRELRQAMLQLASRQNEPPKQQQQEPAKEKITRGQLTQILNENRDADGNIRPDILMNIVDHLVAESTAEAKASAFKEFDETNWARQINSSSKAFMSGISLNAQDQAEVGEFVKNLKLENNPASEMIGYALLRLAREHQGQQSQPAVEDKVKDEPKTSAAKMDKTKVTSRVSPEDRPGKSKVQLSQEQIKMAKQLGVKLETYAKFVKGA